LYGQPDSLAARINQLEAEFRKKIEEINIKTSRSSKDQNEKVAIIPPSRPSIRSIKEKMKNGASYNVNDRLSKASTLPSSCSYNDSSL